jgi:hypothetical protein
MILVNRHCDRFTELSVLQWNSFTDAPSINTKEEAKKSVKPGHREIVFEVLEELVHLSPNEALDAR